MFHTVALSISRLRPDDSKAVDRLFDESLPIKWIRGDGRPWCDYSARKNVASNLGYIEVQSTLPLYESCFFSGTSYAIGAFRLGQTIELVQ